MHYSPKASILGPCKVIPLKQDTIFCKVIDFLETDEITPHLAECVYREALFMGHECAKSEIAYRGGYRWIRFLEPCTNYIESTKKSRIKSKGVYLITGGLGGIGLVLAQYLAEHYQAHLILVSRAGKPKQNATSYETEDSLTNMNMLQCIESAAASVTIESASVENEEQMGCVIHRALQRFGKIDGVIHAAGVAGGGIAQFKSIEEYNRVLQPKLQGTQTLLKLFKDETLDFNSKKLLKRCLRP